MFFFEYLLNQYFYAEIPLCKSTDKLIVLNNFLEFLSEGVIKAGLYIKEFPTIIYPCALILFIPIIYFIFNDHCFS